MRTALTVAGPDGPKTYSATEDDITMGLCEDVIHAFRADLMVGGLDGPDSAEVQNAVASAMMANIGGFYPFASRLFPGLTEEEWRSSKPSEAVGVMRDVLGYGLSLLGELAPGDGKPRKRKNRLESRRLSTRYCSTSQCRCQTGSRR